jgi:hypothetical protein
MTFDLSYRYAQALDPAGLDSIAACLHAIGAAARDSRNAGKSFECDPAVVLLAQHLGRIAADRMPDTVALRRLCADAITEIARTPLLPVLAARGVGHDADAKRAFHAEGRRRLRRLAGALGLASADYEVRICAGGPAVAGEVILHADALYVQLGLSGTSGHAILFRTCRDRDDHTGGRNHWATIAELLDPFPFAARIARELGLPWPGAAPAPQAA